MIISGVEEPTLMYIGFFVLPFFFTLISNKIFIRFTNTLGLRQNGSGDIRWSVVPKPAIGGITFYLVFLLSATGFFFFVPVYAEQHRDTFTGLIAASTLAFLMGLADDAYGTKPLIKFITQVLCGITMFFSGTQISFFDHSAADFVLTIVWVVGIMNSINMIDNMDGIATSVSIFIMATFILILFYLGASGDIHLPVFIALAASLLAFLRYNWNPSKIFMGDNGSQFLGVILAYGGIRYLWNFNDGGDHQRLLSVLLVSLVFCIPLSDTVMVIINRIAKGYSPFIGGKDHTTHHLTFMGFNDKQVAWLFIVNGMISFALTAGIALLFSHYPAVICGFFLYPSIVFITLFIMIKKQAPKS